jgi:class 3 adenylate cyclase/tetratricopeptide (TPR) repeat protein
VAERRLVSVLFVDLVGFTPFAEARDAEEVRETLTRYFDLASEVVARYGGSIEKFIGDAVMAIWGAPVAREDDAERAVRAGLDLVDAVGSLGAGIAARAGVLTGEAAVSVGAANQGMVAGDLVNTAARLQAIAPAGSVLVGEATYRAASRAVAFEEAGPQVLKGKQAPVSAWRAVRVVAQRGGRGRSDLPEPPFVGRQEELRFLKDAVNSTGRERRPRLVSITGPAGIGKSRLAWELEKHIDGVLEPVYWHRGRSPAYGDGITFWALGEMVRRRAGLAEADDEARTRERIGATVAEHVPDPEDRRWVEPALLTLLGLEPGPAGGRDVLFAAWRIFFERIALKGTTILLFEDLQWADSGLLDFIDYLLEWSKGVPLLVVTLARPELFDRRPEWGAARRNFTAVALEPLSEPAMRELLAGFVPGLPETAVRAILARADGVPLYAVETVRALVADGRLRAADGAYRPVGELGELRIPETLRSLIASRLDGLDPFDRTIVQGASVLGQTFTLAGLAAACEREPGELEGRLRGMVRRELFELEADQRSPERGQYRFVQALIREVAYGTLARRERRARHLAVARYFEVLGEDELAGALAAHYLAAHEASANGAEADAVAVQARLALRGAAERAATLGAHDQAVGYLRQALEVTHDPAERAELLERAAVSADSAARYEEASAFGEEAVAAYARSGGAVAAARTTALLGDILINAGQLDRATQVLEAALAGLTTGGEEAVRCALLTSLSRSLFRNNASARAVEVADLALAIAERLDLERELADAFNNKGAGLSYLGRTREAAALTQAAVEVAARGGFVRAELRARGNLSSVLFGSDLKRSLDTARTALELARRLGQRMMANWLVGSVIACLYFLGEDWGEADREVREALAGDPSPADEARLLSLGALIWVARGEPSDDALARLDAIAAELSDPSIAGSADFLRGDRMMLTGDHPAGFDALVRAARSSEGTQTAFFWYAIRSAAWHGDLARCRDGAAMLEATLANDPIDRVYRRASHAAILALEGREREASAAFADALRRWSDLGVGFFGALTALDILVLLGREVPEARQAAEDARTVFAALGARPYLERLDAALAGSVAPVVPLGRLTPGAPATSAGEAASRSL